ncbi:hypothetical protein BJY52DRAFT_103625 [Lactarius psammicola]|nr:hypothetical protein BJY52DRAFT_103625 [Lactarius psammicola]
MAGFNLTHYFNCEAWFRALLVFSYFCIAFSSLLILLRGVAIWGRSITVLIFTAFVWLCNIGIAIYSVMQGSTQWSPVANACLISGTKSFPLGHHCQFHHGCDSVNCNVCRCVEQAQLDWSVESIVPSGACYHSFRSSDFPSSVYATLSGPFVDFSCIFCGDSTCCMHPFFFCFRSVRSEMLGSTGIELGKYRWYVAKDYQHQLITE